MQPRTTMMERLVGSEAIWLNKGSWQSETCPIEERRVGKSPDSNPPPPIPAEAEKHHLTVTFVWQQ